MLIKIGNAFIDPAEIAAVTGERGSSSFPDAAVHRLFIYLRCGDACWIDATMDEAEAALIDAGYIESPYPEEPVELDPQDAVHAADLLADGYQWLARDGDGNLYAYLVRPERDGAYWGEGLTYPAAKRLRDGFGFVREEDEEPWEIAALLGDI